MNVDLIMPAFIKAQALIHNAELDSTNPHFKSKYASLESVLAAVKPHLNANGIGVTQLTGIIGDQITVITRLIHVSGQMLESATPVLMEQKTAQKMGSGITYARRYGLAAICGIGSDDDDGNDASKTSPQPQERSVMSKPVAKVPTSKMETCGDYVMQFGKDTKGKKLSDLGVDKVSSMIAFVRNKADEKFRESTNAKEFLFWADAYLKKSPMNDLDRHLGSNVPMSGDVSKKTDDWMNEPTEFKQ